MATRSAQTGSSQAEATMSSATSQAHTHHHRAPHLRMRPRTKTDDIFARFSSKSASPSNVPDLDHPSASESGQEPQSSKISHIRTAVLTPIYLLAYLISMLYVARRNDHRRHALSASSTFPRTGAEKHQDAQTGVWAYSAETLQHQQRQKEQQQGSRENEGTGWFVSKKHRKVLGMEMREAEEVHEVVMIGIVVMAAVGMVGLGLGLWVYGRRSWWVS